MLPKLTFVSTAETERNRLLFTHQQMARGFYQAQNFLLSEKLAFNANPVQTVLHPQFKNPLALEYWESLKTDTLLVPAQSHDRNRQLLQKTFMGKAVSQEIIDQKHQDFQKAFPSFFQFVRLLFPEECRQIAEIQVIVTAYGTCSSFGKPPKESQGTLSLFLRQDMDVSHIAEVILTALFANSQSHASLDWNERELVVDSLMQTETLSALFPNFSPTMPSVQKTTQKQLEESQTFLQSLGAPLQTLHQDVVVTHDLIQIDSHSITLEFSKNEIALLNELWKNQNTIVSYDTLAALLWPNDLNRFSLWAMNRAVSRLRTKLVAQNFPASLHNHYGLGYSLTHLVKNGSLPQEL